MVERDIEDIGPVDERESEFTGLKGALLRYAGCTYALVLLSQFLEALAGAWWCPAPLAPVLAGASAILFPLAFAAYPVAAGIRRVLGAPSIVQG